MKKAVQILISALAAACVVGLVVLLVGWLARWDSGVAFSNGFTVAGGLLIVLGCLSVLGGYKIRSDFGVVYSQSAGDMNTLERSKLWIADISQGYNSMFFLLLTGVILIGFAVLAHRLF